MPFWEWTKCSKHTVSYVGLPMHCDPIPHADIWMTCASQQIMYSIRYLNQVILRVEEARKWQHVWDDFDAFDLFGNTIFYGRFTHGPARSMARYHFMDQVGQPKPTDQVMKVAVSLRHIIICYIICICMISEILNICMYLYYLIHWWF